MKLGFASNAYIFLTGKPCKIISHKSNIEQLWDEIKEGKNENQLISASTIKF
jgi:hypothetical protein